MKIPFSLNSEPLPLKQLNREDWSFIPHKLYIDKRSSLLVSRKYFFRNRRIGLRLGPTRALVLGLRRRVARMRSNFYYNIIITLLWINNAINPRSGWSLMCQRLLYVLDDIITFSQRFRAVDNIVYQLYNNL